MEQGNLSTAESRVNLKVFPYYIAYVIHSGIIWILAIAHGARRPEYWLERRVSV